MLNPAVTGAAAALRENFASARPFRHVVIEDFFTQEFLHALVREFPDFASGNFIGDDGAAGGKSTNAKVRGLGPAYQTLDEAIQGAPFLRLMEQITGIDNLLYDPFYLGGGTHENRNGQSLAAHVDFNYHPSERWHRRLNLIVYLNDDWQESWGGALELYRDPYADAAPAVRVVPSLSRAVLFETTEHSWHGFDTIRLPESEAQRTRKSIALYFYSKDRPASEAAPRHTTHYVNQQLPQHFQASHTLTKDDINQLKALIQSRDTQLRGLYAENTKLRKAQDAGLSGQLLYLLKRAYVRFRR